MLAKSLEINQESLETFPIDKITDNSVTDFDLFLNISNHLVLYGASGYRWYRRELQELLRHGWKDFFIRSEDSKKARMYEKLCLIPMIDKNQAPEERIVSIEEIGSIFVKYLYEGEITPACVEKAKGIADSLIGCISEDVSCVQALSGLGDHDYYTYVHSIRVASYTVAIAVEMGLTNEDCLRELALGGILHDIGKKEIPLELINKTGVLTDAEWEKMRSHPVLGFETIQETLNLEIPRQIILYHHEKIDGSGYPEGLQKSSLLPEVQIATLADVFDALTSTRAYQQKRTRYEALDFIRHKMLKTKIAAEPFQALVSCLYKD